MTAPRERSDSATPLVDGVRRRLRHPQEPVFDQGLGFDLETLIDRRRLLKLLGLTTLGGGLLALAGCGSTVSDGGSGATTTASSSAAPAAPAAAECEQIPQETAGPFPGDGSNGPDVLAETEVVRSDIRASFAGSVGTAEGIPLTIRLLLIDRANGCAPLAGGAVYLWHCDRDGNYSIYSDAIADQNYLRGVQEASAEGVVTFTSIFPGCYQGRWPHIHFEVYPDLARATDDANAIATSQIAMPADACAAAYGSGGYAASAANLAGVSLETDLVFGDDGGVRQLGAITGGLEGGYTVELAVPVSR